MTQKTLRRAAIVAPVRTPVGTFGGSLRPLAVEDLGAAVVKAVLQRTRIDPGLVEDMVFAQSYANSETPCVGRWIALHSGLPIAATGVRIMTTLLHELNRRKGRYGLETMCIGGGRGLAALFEGSA